MLPLLLDAGSEIFPSGIDMLCLLGIWSFHRRKHTARSDATSPLPSGEDFAPRAKEDGMRSTMDKVQRVSVVTSDTAALVLFEDHLRNHVVIELTGPFRVERAEAIKAAFDADYAPKPAGTRVAPAVVAMLEDDL